MTNVARTVFVVVLCICLLVPAAGAQDALARWLQPAVERLGAGLPGHTVVSFGTITYADKKVGSSFSRYLEETLAAFLARDGRFELFPRDQLDAILMAQELNVSDLVDQKAVVPLGKMKDIQALLSGTFFEAGAEVKVFLELLSVGKATVIARAEAAIPRTLIPSSVSILPDNYNDALYVLEQLASVQGTIGGSLEVKAWNVRGDGGVYRDGEKLVVNFYASRACFVKVYHVDAQGKTQLIFPNQFLRDNALKAGRIYRIPDSSYPFTFDLGAPYGTEFIKVVASTTQFTDIEAAFTDMGKVTRGTVSRGLVVTGVDTQVAEATFSYTILN